MQVIFQLSQACLQVSTYEMSNKYTSNLMVAMMKLCKNNHFCLLVYSSFCMWAYIPFKQIYFFPLLILVKLCVWKTPIWPLLTEANIFIILKTGVQKPAQILESLGKTLKHLL